MSPTAHWRRPCAGAALALTLLMWTSGAGAGADAPGSAATTATSATTAAPALPALGATGGMGGIQPADDAWRAALPRGADAATEAYLARLSPQAVARSNAYYEGGYWLLLWNMLATVAACLLLLSGRRSARLAAWCQGAARRRVPVADALFAAAFTLWLWTLTLPLTIWQLFVREHQYGMATQDFGAWFAEQLTGLLVSIVMAMVAVTVLYAILRRVQANWWGWAGGVGVLLTALLLLVSPVWIDPLFNTYRPVEHGEVRSAVLAMAHADGVPADEVYEFDASRQTTRVSANVSGILGTAAVRLNDNLLRRSSLPEIRAVMGHELGHYVLNHTWMLLAEFSLLYLAGARIAQWALARLLARHGGRLGLGGVQDVASLPLLFAVLSVLAVLATPVTNTVIRSHEIEADRFGLNLSREPHGFAEAILKLTEYRKPDPAPWEEFVFYDHPSTRFRIHDAMRWREAMGTP